MSLTGVKGCRLLIGTWQPWQQPLLRESPTYMYVCRCGRSDTEPFRTLHKEQVRLRPAVINPLITC